MTFQSLEFFAFFVLTLAAYWSLPHRTQNVLLLYDSDRAGLEATFKSGDELLSLGMSARVMTLLAMLLFLAMGAHRVALGYLIESFRVVPIGQSADISSSALIFVNYLSQAVEAGVRLSLPVVGVALIVQAALALVSRASPQLQVFSIGMGISVAAAFLTVLGTLNDTAAGLGAEMEHEAPRIEEVLSEAAAK